MNYKMIILMVFMLFPLVEAAAVMPVDQEDLDNGVFTPKTTFEEGEELGLYGVGFEADTEYTVTLEDGETFEETYTTTSNGILTTLGRGIKNLVAGIYDLFVSTGDSVIQHVDKIIVNGGDDDDEPGDPCPEVPEFTTVCSGLVLIGAGWLINKKRGSA